MSSARYFHDGITREVKDMKDKKGGPIFLSESRGRLSLDEVMEEITAFVRRDPGRYYKIIIGTDSHASDVSTLVTTLIVWRVGNGAIHFWIRSKERDFGSMRDRIWAEALASITLGQEMRSRLQTALGDEFFWDGNEIHVDIGKNGPTKDMVDSVTGMIRGYDFIPVIKPYSFGASIVADRHT